MSVVNSTRNLSVSQSMYGFPAIRLSFAAVVWCVATLHANDRSGHRVPSPAIAAIVDAPLPPLPVLSSASFEIPIPLALHCN